MAAITVITVDLDPEQNDDVVYHASRIKRMVQDAYPDAIVQVKCGETVWKPLYDWKQAA